MKNATRWATNLKQQEQYGNKKAHYLFSVLYQPQ
jgi:hypothetical protein